MEGDLGSILGRLSINFEGAKGDDVAEIGGYAPKAE
jgi:hypothetical protein